MIFRKTNGEICIIERAEFYNDTSYFDAIRRAVDRTTHLSEPIRDIASLPVFRGPKITGDMGKPAITNTTAMTKGGFESSRIFQFLMQEIQ